MQLMQHSILSRLTQLLLYFFARHSLSNQKNLIEIPRQWHTFCLFSAILFMLLISCSVMCFTTEHFVVENVSISMCRKSFILSEWTSDCVCGETYCIHFFPPVNVGVCVCLWQKCATNWVVSFHVTVVCLFVQKRALKCTIPKWTMPKLIKWMALE